MKKFMVADLIKEIKEPYPEQIIFEFRASSGSWKWTIFTGSPESGGPAKVRATHNGNGTYRTVITFPHYGDYEYPDIPYESIKRLQNEGSSHYNQNIRITPQGSD